MDWSDAKLALAAAVGFLARWAFGRGVGKVDGHAVELKVMAERYADVTKRLEMGNQSFQFLREQLEEVKRELAELRRSRHG